MKPSLYRDDLKVNIYHLILDTNVGIFLAVQDSSMTDFVGPLVGAN